MIESYLLSNWGIAINTICILIFVPFSLRKLSIHRAGTSGKFTTEGIITWSEHGLWSNTDFKARGCLISYSYSVGKQNYNNTIHRTRFVHGKILSEKYPKGKKVKVYYSPSNPEYSWVGRRPNQFRILLMTVKGYFIAPILLINLFTYLVYIFSFNR
jgi:hypothetical protein